MPMRIQYPWKRLEKGQGFFVPCLDYETQRIHGLKAAVHERVLDARAVPGVFKGATGVWFYRRPRVPSRRA